MKINKIFNCILCSLFFLLPGCMIIDSSPHIGTYGMGAGAPEANKDGEFTDTTHNRSFFEERVDRDIADEKSDVTPYYDWQRAWRVSFEEIYRSSENPEYKKEYILNKRKEAGLPIWPFMLR